jgi:hypothetical protein
MLIVLLINGDLTIPPKFDILYEIRRDVWNIKN